MNSSFIRLFARRLARLKARPAAQPESPVSEAQFRSPEFVETLFACMGHIAGIDGRVNEQEIAFARQLMARLQLSTGATHKAMLAFNAGKANSWPMLTHLARLQARYPDKRWVQHCFVEWQIRFCLADGSLQNSEKVQLARIARALNINQLQFSLLIARATPKAPTVSGPNIADDLAIFQLPTQATWHQVKQAYRRLIGQCHPDRHADGEAQAKQLNAAYHRLDQHWRQYQSFQ